MDPTTNQPSPSQRRDTVTVIDNRTGKSIELPLINGEAISALEFRRLTLSDADINGIRLFDPGFLQTAVCRSKITYIDGDKGILLHRGYPIEQLAERSTFTEVAYLLINGELPTPSQLADWDNKIMSHTFLHEDLLEMMKCNRYDAHPMGIMVSTMAALSTFHPEANPALQGSGIYATNEKLRNKQIYRILGKVSTIAANAYRLRIGRNFNHPSSDGSFSYAENFLMMIDKLSEVEYRPSPRIVRIMDVLLILHADHELNCSTAAVRHVASARSDPFSCVAAGMSALYGPLHGGANQSVVQMLEEIGHVDRIPAFLEDVRNKKRLLYGFGHRVYKSYDPRCAIAKKLATEVFEIMGRDPLVEVVLALEKEALESEYFKSRRLYPNVDLWTGIIFKTLGFTFDIFPVLFAVGRTAGWLAHLVESWDAGDNIARPRQLYEGAGRRDFVEIGERPAVSVPGGRPLECYQSSGSRRRDAGLKVPSRKE